MGVRVYAGRRLKRDRRVVAAKADFHRKPGTGPDAPFVKVRLRLAFVSGYAILKSVFRCQSDRRRTDPNGGVGKIYF